MNIRKTALCILVLSAAFSIASPLYGQAGPTPPPIWSKLMTGAWYENLRLVVFGLGAVLVLLGFFIRGIAFLNETMGKETGTLGMTANKLVYGGIALVIAVSLLTWFLQWLAAQMGYTPSASAPYFK